METKELKIQVPEGYEVDTKKSTFENIVFKKKEEKRWRDDKNEVLRGYYIGLCGDIIPTTTSYYNEQSNYNIFATEKQAKSALAMARISQIMANDKRFGGPITDKEWANLCVYKYSIDRKGNRIIKIAYIEYHAFLTFHTSEQRDLFLIENYDLVKDYLMIE